MSFELGKYLATKERMIAHLKEIHDWQDSEGVIADGLISPGDYSRAPLKIVAILGESYGYDECGVTDIEIQTERDILGVGRPSVKTTKKLPALLWLILETVSRKKLIEWDDVPFLLQTTSENITRLQSALCQVGWVNVKKASKPYDDETAEPTRQDAAEILDHGKRNAAILREQVTSIDPNLIIVCSDPVMQSICEQQILRGVEPQKKWQVQISSDGARVIHVSHPSYFRDWSYRGVYDTYRLIMAGLGSGPFGSSL